MGPSAIERRWDIMRYCKDTEIWTLNNAYHTYAHIMPDISRWFELHNWEYLREWKSGVPDHFVQLDALGAKVYTSEPLPKIRNQYVIPWVEVFTHFVKGGASNYFLGSPSLMLVLALYEHDKGKTIEYIQSWGIDTSDQRHAQQRQSWAYWCAQAHTRGIRLGGTMTEFMREPETDDGLRGLREAIGNRIKEETLKKEKKT